MLFWSKWRVYHQMVSGGWWWTRRGGVSCNPDIRTSLGHINSKSNHHHHYLACCWQGFVLWIFWTYSSSLQHILLLFHCKRWSVTDSGDANCCALAVLMSCSYGSKFVKYCWWWVRSNSCQWGTKILLRYGWLHYCLSNFPRAFSR